MSSSDIVEALYRLYEQPMYRAAAAILGDRYAAEDAVQEAFVRLIAHRRSLAPPETPSCRAYVMKTLRSCATDAQRRRSRERGRATSLPDEALVEIEDALLAPPDDALLAEELLAALPTGCREVVICRFRWGLTSAETAAVLGISEASERKRFSRAKTYLADKRK